MKCSALVGIIVTSLYVSTPAVAQEDEKNVRRHGDMLTPVYYEAGSADTLRTQVDTFLTSARKERFHHPLRNERGQIPRFNVWPMGRFGAGKGPGGDKQHHPAVDFYVGNRETKVTLHAAHDGRVSTFRDAPKYRHYLAITKDVTDDAGAALGKIVTIYGHLDLDLDESDGLPLNGAIIRKGDVVSRHLYSGTRGGPHLHLEIRYYRAGDKGTEAFYGFRFPGNRDSNLTKKSAKPFSYGYWNPHVGYGFADPRNHGITCY
jgi:murein DD-endopeptidase MepM/ murein hydrolase activator NlpD